MNEEQVVSDLQELCRRVFRNPDVQLQRSTTAADVAGWDSLSHAALIVEVERHFDIRLALAEIMSLDTVGDLVDMVMQKATEDGATP